MDSRDASASKKEIVICIISQLKQKTWQFQKRGVDKKQFQGGEGRGEDGRRGRYVRYYSEI